MKADDPPKRQRRRILSREEFDLWREVTKSVVPRHRMRVEKETEALIPVETSVPVKQPRPIRAAPIAAKPAIKTVREAPSPKDIDRRTRQGLARQHLEIDAKIDLHGMRQERAFQALSRFLVSAQGRGCRLVLVVTGKGTTTDTSDIGGVAARGILRRNVPHWLASPEMRAFVVGFSEAARAHGGAGALYVQLRRTRPLKTSGH